MNCLLLNPLDIPFNRVACPIILILMCFGIGFMLIPSPDTAYYYSIGLIALISSIVLCSLASLCHCSTKISKQDYEEYKYLINKNHIIIYTPNEENSEII